MAVGRGPDSVWRRRMTRCFLVALSVLFWSTCLPAAAADDFSGSWAGPWYRGMTSGTMELRIDADGAGVIQALEVLRLFKVLGIKPRHTLRCVFFMNEENGSKGAKAYAQMCKERGEIHLAAMESDRGGFAPRGFHIDATPLHVEYLQQWLPLFEPYLMHIVKPGYGGVDINPLKEFGTPLIGVVPDSQRYFDVHHTAYDVFETVNQRELELGAAGMTSLVYLIDKYGFPVELDK